MAGSIAPLVTKLVMDSSDFIRGMDTASSAAERGSRRISGAVRSEMRQATQAAKEATQEIQNVWQRMESAISVGGVAIAAGFGAAMVRQAAEIADAYTGIEGRIRLATKATGDFATVNQQLFMISQQTGTAFENSAMVFQRLQMSAKDLGASNKDILGLVKTVEQLGTIGGSSTQAMNAGLMQLTQLLGMGTAHAEELNSIAENLPALQKKITEGFGMTWAEIKAQAADGKITSREVFEAIMKGAEDTNKEFGNMPVTMSRAWIEIQNSTQKAIGSLNEATGATTAVGQAMEATSRAIDQASEAFQKWATQKDERGMTYQEQQRHGWDQITIGIENAIAAFNEYLELRERQGQGGGSGSILQGAMAAGGSLVGDSMMGGMSLLRGMAKDQIAKTFGSNFLNTGIDPAKLFDQQVPQFPDLVSGTDDDTAIKVRDQQLQQQIAAVQKKNKASVFGPPTPDKEQQKSIDKFDDYINGLKEQARLTDMINKGLGEQAAIEKALYDAAQKKGAELNDTEKEMVTNAAKAKYAADEQKKAIKDTSEATREALAWENKRHDTIQKVSDKYQDIMRSLQAQASAMAMSNVDDEAAAKIAQDRYDLEKKIADLKKGYDIRRPIKDAQGNVVGQETQHFSLSQQGEDELRFQFEQNALARQGNASAQKQVKFQNDFFENKLGGMDDRAFARYSSFNQNTLEGRLARERMDLQAQMESQHIGGANAQQNLSQFDVYANRQRTVAMQEQLRTMRDQTAEMRQQQREKDLINQGLDEQAAYERNVFDIEKQIGRELTAQEKQYIANNAAAQTFFEKMDKSRALINSMKSEQEKYNDRVRELNSYFQNGLISLNQYNRLLVQMSPQFQRFHDMASDMAQALGKAFDDAILKGGKFTDVMKNLGKEILNIMAKRLILDPFVKWSTGALTQLFTGVNPNAGIGQFQGTGAQPGGMPSANPLGGLLGGLGLPPGLANLFSPTGGLGLPGIAGGGAAAAGGFPMDPNEFVGAMADLQRNTTAMVALLEQIAQCSCGAGGVPAGGFNPGPLGPMSYGAGLPAGGLPPFLSGGAPLSSFGPGGLFGDTGGGWGGGGGGGWSSGAPGGGPGGYTPSYYDASMALAGIGRYREQQYLNGGGGGINSMGMSTGFSGGINGMGLGGYLQKEYDASRGAGQGGYNFGSVPGIGNGANDFYGMIQREPGLAGVLDPRFVGWAQSASGGIGRNSYQGLITGYASGDGGGMLGGPGGFTDYSLRDPYYAGGARGESAAGSPYNQAKSWYGHALGGMAGGGGYSGITNIGPGMGWDWVSRNGAQDYSPYFGHDANGAVARLYDAGGPVARLGAPFLPTDPSAAGDLPMTPTVMGQLMSILPQLAQTQRAAPGQWGMVPGRAYGGHVNAGQWYQVNEGGRKEYFKPDTAGNIGNPAGGGNVSIVIHENAGGVQATPRVTPLPGGGQQIDIAIDAITAANVRNNRDTAGAIRTITAPPPRR